MECLVRYVLDGQHQIAADQFAADQFEPEAEVELIRTADGDVGNHVRARRGLEHIIADRAG